MIDKIITDQTILRQLSTPTTKAEVKSLKLIKRLRKSNRTAWTKGCGLAAIQINIPIRFAWFTLNGKDEILLNPEIIESHGSRVYRNEGCLSIPNSYVNTERFYQITYVSGGRKQTAINFKAILIQHEIDHMNGILNIDRKMSQQTSRRK